MSGKTSLIVGGAGQLGQHVVNSFKKKGWKLMSIDIKENLDADTNIVMSTEEKIQH